MSIHCTRCDVLNAWQSKYCAQCGASLVFQAKKTGYLRIAGILTAAAAIVVAIVAFV